MTGLKTPTGRRATSWLFTRVALNLISGRLGTNPAIDQSGTGTGTVGSQVREALTTQPHCLPHVQYRSAPRYSNKCLDFLIADF